MSYFHFSSECDEYHGLVRDFGGKVPRIACLCGSTRFYDQFQQANYDLTMRGEIVLSVGFYPHAKAEHGHGEGVGHDSAEKVALDELHKRKIDLADYVFVVSDEDGYFGQSTASEIAYAVERGKPVLFAEGGAYARALDAGLVSSGALTAGVKGGQPLVSSVQQRRPGDETGLVSEDPSDATATRDGDL